MDGVKPIYPPTTSLFGGYNKNEVLPYWETLRYMLIHMFKMENNPNEESKYDIKESGGNMFNPIFKENAQGQKHPGRYIFAEPKLPSSRKPKYVDQNEYHGIGSDYFGLFSLYFSVLAPYVLPHWSFGKVILKTHFSNRHIDQCLRNLPQVNVIGPHWWDVNINSGNGLGPLDTKTLPGAMLIKLHAGIWRYN